MDSLQQTDALIVATSENAASDPLDHELVVLSLTLEELSSLREKLAARIAKATQALLGKDQATAAAVNQAIKDEYLLKRMKANAIRLKIKHQVQDILLMSVSYKRRTLRNKNGESLLLTI